jgi:hypothetical protein
MALHSLQQHNENLAAKEDPLPSETNGFVLPEVFNGNIAGGNGLLTISTRLSAVRNEKDEIYEVSVLDHATNETTGLGNLTAMGFHTKVDFCGTGTPPGFCTSLTQNGSHLVLFGPRKCEMPVISIYQLVPPVHLFEKRFKDIPFSNCDADRIALSPVGITNGHYLVAIVTSSMAVILLNATTLQRSSLQLQSIRRQSCTDVYHACLKGKCIDFSPDGRFLSVLCFMQIESANACLIIDAAALEPLCWFEANGHFIILRWLFPMFSACGTKIAVSTYPDFEDRFDENKYEIKFYKISTLQSLKVLSRVAILERVSPALLDQLPLPRDLIAFLSGYDIAAFQGTIKFDTHDESENGITCKCTLL